MSYKEEILPWVILANYTVTLVMAGFAVYFTVNLIRFNFISKLSTSYSSTMTFYFCFASVSGTITVINTAYMIAFWRPGTVIYNAYIIFFTGVIATRLQAGVPVIEFFLCVDRCLTIMFPIKYNGSYKKFTTIMAVTTYGVLTIIFFIVTGVFDSLPQTTETNCTSVGCLKPSTSSSYTSAQKCCIAAANCLAALYLGYLMKTRITASHTIKRLNKVVLHMLIVAFFFDFLPNLLSIITPLLSFKVSDYIGAYGNTATTINVTLSCYLYWKMFKRTLLNKVEITSSNKQPTGWTTA